MKRYLPLLAILLLQLCTAAGQVLPQMRKTDAYRIKEALTISSLYSNAVWKGMDKTPFVVLLVTDTAEFLINHPNPSSDFVLIGEDSILKTKIYTRKQQLSKSFLATFPAVNGINCIVAGTPENTGKNSTDWIITLLHEHFHQYQFTQNDYYSSVSGLNLAGEDNTGMWQLNYPFPYDSLPVIKQYEVYTSALYYSVKAIGQRKFKPALKKITEERKKLEQMLRQEDYRYFSFQLWQEGIARYTEYKFLQLLTDYMPSTEISALPDFVSFKKFKEEFLTKHLKAITALKLNREKRICFYSIGLAEGILLDKLNPDWRSQYLTEKFFIEKYASGYRTGYK